MSKKLRVVIVGSGKLAWHLAPAIENSGHPIVGIYSRNKTNAENLCSRLYNAEVLSSPDFNEINPDVILISVSDHAIEIVSNELAFPSESIIAHTAGGRNAELLNNHCNYGVFYPLQTFSKDRKINFEEIPILLEYNNDYSGDALTLLANGISTKVFIADSEERNLIHLAAVFACNFTNHLLALSNNFLEESNIDFNLIKPLIQETFAKAVSADPKHMQTGPAIRKDKETLEKHLQLLDEKPELKKIYKLLSESIIRLAEQK
ncbi:MAG: Rossmann-like and DUF2520 domain-containing protein [Cytophagaceae bacterium]